MKLSINMSVKESVIVIGYGYWGRKVTNEYLKLVDSNEVDNIYIYEKDPKLLNLRDPRLKIVSNLKLIPSDVHFAHVCTPNNSHFELTKQLLERGCAVLVEKPMSEYSSEAEQMINIAEKHSLKLKVGMVYRYSQAVEKTKKLINKKFCTRYISASWLHNIDIPNIRRVMKERDVVWDIFIHLLDIVNYLYEDWPSFEHAAGIPNARSQNHTFVSTGRMNEAGFIMKSSFFSHFKERKIEIIGEETDIILDILNNVVTIGTDDCQKKFYFYDNPLYSEILDFVNSGQNLNSSNTGNVGLKETMIIENLLKQQNLLGPSIGEI